MQMKTNFHMKGCAPGLALKKRPRIIRKWAIDFVVSAVNDLPAWTPTVSSELLPQYGLAIMRSNRWPGAVAFAKDRLVDYSLTMLYAI